MSLKYIIEDVVLPAVHGNPGQWVSINDMRKHCVESYGSNTTNTQLKQAIDDELRAYFNTYQIEERVPATGSVGDYEYRCKRADMLDDASTGLKRKQPDGPVDGAAVEDADDDRENGGPPPWTTEELILLVKAYDKHKDAIGNSRQAWSVVLNDDEFKALKIRGRTENSLYQRFRKLETAEPDRLRKLNNSCKKPKIDVTNAMILAKACSEVGAQEAAEKELHSALEKLSQLTDARLHKEIGEVIQKYCTLLVNNFHAANAGAADNESSAFSCLVTHARDVLRHSQEEIQRGFKILPHKPTDILVLNKSLIERHVCTANFQKLEAVLPTLPKLMGDWIKRHLSECLEDATPPHEEVQVGSSQLSKHEAAVQVGMFGMRMEIMERARKEMADRIDQCFQGVVFVVSLPAASDPSPSVSTMRLIETRHMTSEVAKLVKQIVEKCTSASHTGPTDSVSILDKIKAEVSSNAFKQMATALEQGVATLPSMIMNEVKKALLAVLGGVGAH